ncbi:MAG TPA: YqaE/Pmp3 family membrane protein [Lacibacter sp.]|nr:YqaE/Pmp3 family membrane protein [Lacibacter sp.]HMO90284.1 YqaE/Pmp3 family membrane protein [Lacibacter sp.]
MKKLILLSVFAAATFLQPSFAAYVIPQPASELPATAVQQSLEEFRHLSRKEKKGRIAAAKKEMKQMRRQGSDERTILLVILAILLPPLAVYLHQEAINTKFWISLILTLLFWVPGVIYSLLVVLGVV